MSSKNDKAADAPATKKQKTATGPVSTKTVDESKNGDQASCKVFSPYVPSLLEAGTSAVTYVATEEKGPEGVGYPKVLLFNNKCYPFDPHKVLYAEPKASGHGGFVVKCKYPLQVIEGEPPRNVDLVLQTPECRTSFGMSSKEHEAGKVRGTIDIAFGEDSGLAAANFRAVMKLWDSLILGMAKTHKQKWFRSAKITDDIIAYLYNSMVRENVSKADGHTFADTFRANITRRADKFVCDVYDASRETTSLEEIKRGSSIRLIAAQTGIWINDTMVVSSFAVRQVQKFADGETMQGYAFVDDEESAN